MQEVLEINKSRLLKKLTILSLGLLIFNILPIVQATQTDNIRPIEDWIYGNDPSAWDPTDIFSYHTKRTWDDWDRSDTMAGNPFGSWKGFSDSDTDLGIGLGWLALNNEVEYDGFVLEREMPDGSLKISVNLHVRNIYIEVYQLSEGWGYPGYMFTQELVLVGKMNYHFIFDFVLEKEIPGGYIMVDYPIPSGTREPGAELPPLFMIWYFGDIIGARVISFKFTGMGSGDLVEPGWLPPISPTFDLWDQPDIYWHVPPPNTPDNPPVSTGETAIVNVQYKYLKDLLWFPNSGFEMVKVF